MFITIKQLASSNQAHYDSFLILQMVFCLLNDLSAWEEFLVAMYVYASQIKHKPSTNRGSGRPRRAIARTNQLGSANWDEIRIIGTAHQSMILSYS